MAHGSLEGIKVGLDPGHGAGLNKGVHIDEGDWVLDAALRARRHLENHGATVIMTRMTGESLPLSERIEILNSNNVDIAISIHSNAASSPSAGGVEVYSCELNPYPAASRYLAELLLNRTLTMVYSRSRGAKECLDARRGFHFTMVRRPRMPAALPEYFFHTNDWENYTFHLQENGREIIARSLYAAVCDYYQVTPRFDEPVSTKFSPQQWVQTTEAGLELRAGPGTDYDSIDQLPYHTIVRIKPHQDNGDYATQHCWWYVELYEDGRTGWLAEYYLQDSKPPTRILTFAKEGEGRIDIDGVLHPLPCAEPLHIETEVTLEAVPDDLWVFSHWSGDLDTEANPVTIEITDIGNITAVFTPLTVVSGRVELQDFIGDPTTVPVTIEVRAPGSTIPIEIHDVRLCDEGEYRFGTRLGGVYDLAAKGPTWLRQVQNNMHIAEGGAVADFSLVNGDLTGNNRIDLANFNLLISAFGKDQSELIEDLLTDLNGSGETDFDDWEIVIRNFGLIGDD